MRDSLNCPVDVAIATPESLLRYRHREQVKLSDVRHLVIDEADTMFDASFLNSALSILRSVQVGSMDIQRWCVCMCVHCSQVVQPIPMTRAAEGSLQSQDRESK